MALRHRKLRVQFNPTCVDVSTLLDPVRAEYPSLIYLGIWYHDGYGYVYAQNAERMSDTMLTKLLKDHMEITDISSYYTVGGELQEEWRFKPFRANRRADNSNDTKAIIVHSLHQESLQHITREFVADLLKQMLNIDVFFKFGLKLYSLEQNINFRARKGYKKVRVRCDDGWKTVPKDEAYDELIQILVERTQQAVRMFRCDIPPYYIDHFDTYANGVLDYADCSVPKYRKLYEKRRNKCLDNIAVSVNDRLSRLSSWGGKKLKLV